MAAEAPKQPTFNYKMWGGDLLPEVVSSGQKKVQRFMQVQKALLAGRRVTLRVGERHIVVTCSAVDMDDVVSVMANGEVFAFRETSDVAKMWKALYAHAALPPPSRDRVKFTLEVKGLDGAPKILRVMDGSWALRQQEERATLPAGAKQRRLC